MSKYNYYRVRWWTPQTRITHKLEGQNFVSFEEAKNKYESLSINSNILQVELLKEEHRDDGELIYENLLRIKDSECEQVWDN